MKEQKEKLHQYFGIIERHIFEPIENTDLSESCYASITLLFSVIDGLGKLIHKNKKVNPGDRFKYLLESLGKDYGNLKDELWEFRNSLIHNGINNISYMSATQKGEEQHLKFSDGNETIFINSTRLLKDVKSFTFKLKEKILMDKNLINDAASRLEWNQDDPFVYWSQYSTPPGSVRFVIQK